MPTRSAALGMGAGGLLVLAQAAVGDVVRPRQRPKYQGLFTGTFAWPVSLARYWAASSRRRCPGGGVLCQPADRGAGAGHDRARAADPARRRPRIDYLGALLLGDATTTLLLLLAWGGTRFPWLSQTALGFVLLTLLLHGLFLWREAVAPEPLIRLALFRNAVFARGVAVGGMMTFAMLGSTVFLPLYFQLVPGMEPAPAGAMLLPQVCGMLLSSVVGCRIVPRLGRNRVFLLAGLGLEALALAGLARFAWIGAVLAVFLVCMGLSGLGMGMGVPNLTTAVQNAVAHPELAAATGAMTFARSLGGAVGVAASGTIMSARLAAAFASVGGGIDVAALAEQGVQALAAFALAQQAAVADAYRTALTGCFLLSGVVMSLAFLLVLGLPELTLRDRIEDRQP